MDSRHERPSLFTNNQNRDADPPPDADTPLAAERFSKEVDRITRKMDRVIVRQSPSERSRGPLRIIGACIIFLTIVAIFGIVMRDRKTNLARTSAKQQITTAQHPGRPPAVPSGAEATPEPAIRDRSGAAPKEQPHLRTAPDTTIATGQSAQAASAQPPSGRQHAAQATGRSASTGHRRAALPTQLSDDDDDDETDVDQTIAFYEPVNRQAKSGSFEVRSANAGKGRNRFGTSQAGTPAPGKRSCVKTTAFLAAKSGGTLDEVLEHNGGYYKMKLTIPTKRLESFKKALAAHDAIATLSVSSASASGGATVIILEMHTRD